MVKRLYPRAGGLQDVQNDFIEETGLEFSFLLAVYEGVGRNPATLDDSVEYAEAIRESRVSSVCRWYGCTDGCDTHDAAGAGVVWIDTLS